MSHEPLASEALESTRRLEWSLHPAEEGDPDTQDDTAHVEPGNIPRVARLMALAIHFEGLLRRGDVPDYATLARLGQVTRARMSQIMDLLYLAPDTQEEILFLPRTVQGRAPVVERDLRPIVSLLDWEEQRAAWRRLRQQPQKNPWTAMTGHAVIPRAQNATPFEAVALQGGSTNLR